MKRIVLLLLTVAISCASTTRKDTPETPPVAPVVENKPKEQAPETNTPAITPPNVAAPKSDLEPKKEAKSDDKSFDEVGYCSWYGEQFQNKPTASGEPFDKAQLTAAHRTLPFGSEVKVLNLENKKETIVKINDRGPFNKARIIDVSEKAAEELDFKQAGVTKVGLTVIKRGDSSKVVKDDDFSLDDEDDEDDDLDDEDTMVPPKNESKPKPSNPPAKETKPVPVKPAPIKPATTPVKPVTPVKPATEPAPAIASKGDQPKGHSVQIGVFKDKKRADAFKAQVKAGGFKETIYQFDRAGTVVVQIGDFSDRNDAVALRDKLKEKNIFGFIPPK
jgi:rare lipoprotein A